jgi:hypothetical protein
MFSTNLTTKQYRTYQYYPLLAVVPQSKLAIGIYNSKVIIYIRNDIRKGINDKEHIYLPVILRPNLNVVI